MDPIAYLILAVVFLAILAALYWKVRFDDVPRVR